MVSEPNAVIAVDIRKLTVKFGEFTAVDQVSLSVRKGEIFGFLGANGAGKTTTIRVLCGLLVPTSGHVRVAGYAPEDGLEKIKTRVGYMSQRFTLYDDLTVAENLKFSGSLRGIVGRKLEQRIEELLEFVGFSRATGAFVKDLPGGIKQQVSLAASILHDPEIVFLDEPTSGVTPGARERFWKLIRELAGKGKTVFVTTHYMDEAEHCERIALMKDGKIIALDSPGGLKASTFRTPLLEILPSRKMAEGSWLPQLRAHPAVESIEPYGMRYHLVISDPARLGEVKAQIPPSFEISQTAPSLEDVFIRLVEAGFIK